MRQRASKAGWFAFVACAAVFTASVPGIESQPHGKTVRVAEKGILIYSSRESVTDLGISGMIVGLPEGTTGYIHYDDLAALPKVPIDLQPDENFSEIKPGRSMHATGIYLDVLAHALGALPSSDMIDATCSDDYRGHYPATYIGEHHPILVIAINHLPTSQWAKAAHQRDPGPYFVAHAHFIPAFKVLSHADRPQVPSGIVRLNFSTIAATYGAIAPRGNFAPGSMQENGFVIARQNCFRCHNQGQYGGLKAGRTWMTLSTWAREQPAYFEKYVSNPKAFETHAKMPGNPGYDKPTLDALAAYFRTFTATSLQDSNDPAH